MIVNPLLQEATAAVARDIIVKNFNSDLIDLFQPLLKEIGGVGPQTAAEIAFALYIALEDYHAKTQASAD